MVQQFHILDRVNTVDLLHCSFAYILDDWGPSQYIDPVSLVKAGKKKRKILFQLRSPFFFCQKSAKKKMPFHLLVRAPLDSLWQSVDYIIVNIHPTPV